MEARLLACERLAARAAIVTGGASGIGRAIAGHFAAHGCAVAVVDVDAERCTEAAAEIGGLPIVADITDLERVGAVIAQSEAAFGRLDILVNNAGVRAVTPIERVTPEAWARTLAVDLTAPFFLMQRAIPAMRRAGRGKVINIASIAAVRSSPNRSAYSAAKAGLLGLTRQAAAELAPANIQVNAIAPGYIETPLAAGYSQDVVTAMLKTCPAGRRGSAIDIADAALFLASAESDYITGVTLAVDGGVLASGGIDAPPWYSPYRALVADGGEDQHELG
jgi:3-oxoacyl-[acyl-carrier protein] reductase